MSKRLGKMLLYAVMVLMLITGAAAMSGCGGNSENSEDENNYSAISDNTVMGRRVFVHDSNIAFFGYKNLLCSAKFQEGSLSEFVVEGGFTGDIYALAVYDGYLYVSASDGIFRYNLGIFEGKSDESPVTLSSDHLSEYNHFEIYDGKLFYMYGTRLGYVPVEGGERVELTDETGDFEVTDNGIYYTKADGTLHLLSLDLSDDKELGEIAAACELSLGGGKLYYRDGNALRAYVISSGETEDTETQEALEESCIPWTDGENILYQNEQFTDRLITSDGDKELDQNYNYPHVKNWGYMYGHYLTSQDPGWTELRITDLASGTVRTYDLANELASELAGIDASGSTGSASGGTDDTSGGTTGSSGDTQTSGGSGSKSYDILDGYQTYEDGSVLYIYGNDFMLTMPDANDWALEQNDAESFSLYFIPSRDAGYGGHLVTIAAYEPGDTSYEQLPSYRVAGRGLNTDKVFIAMFPTDVQFDSNDKTQSARYRELLDYLQKIGEGAVNSPFQTSDGD